MDDQLSEKAKDCQSMAELAARNKELEEKVFVLEAMQKNIPGGYHRCAPEEGFPFLHISERFLNILGWTEEEIKTKFDNKFMNLVHSEDYTLVDDYVAQINGSGNKNSPYQDRIYRLQGKDGYHWVLDTTIFMNIRGESFYQGCISDITMFIEEREKKARELEAALKITEESKEQLRIASEEKNKRLEQEKNEAMAANNMKSQFLSSLSHDIRTPINGIQGMLKIADTYPFDMKKQNECREKMWIASNYLVSLVNNVLNMNRLENKTIDLTEKPFNLIKLLMNITAMTDMQIKAQGLHSVVDWKPDYIKHRYLIGSEEGFLRILMNLNSNAINYNKKGGSIYCRCMEKEQIGDTVWFEIITADSGVGMDEEFLKHAFEPYAQENNPSLNSINGVGLGLSIVKQTVDLMGGTIEVESRIGEGTRYTTRLPFKIDPDPHTEEKISYEAISLKGVRALLVEDNELNLEIAKFHLEKEEIEVHTAVNGQEAVEMFRQSQIGFYDIILMDIMMPVMNGLEAAKAIRSMERADAPAVPIIAMSANAFEEDVKKSLEAGINEHLIKPLDGKKVTDTMKKYLAGRIQQPD